MPKLFWRSENVNPFNWRFGRPVTRRFLYSTAMAAPQYLASDTCNFSREFEAVLKVWADYSSNRHAALSPYMERLIFCLIICRSLRVKSRNKFTW